MRRLAGITGLGMAAVLFSAIALAQMSTGDAPIIPLYPEGTVTSLGVPESRVRQKTGETLIFNVSEPTLELFRPAAGQANGTAVIVAPGGGFVGLGYEAGGTRVARRLALQGVTQISHDQKRGRSDAVAGSAYEGDGAADGAGEERYSYRDAAICG